MQKKQKVHQRSIDIGIYQGPSADTIIVEGGLKDERTTESHRMSGKISPPGAIHHMIVRLQIKMPQLIIEDIEVEMPTVPNSVCLETISCLTPVKGMSIIAGYTSKVKSLIGGPKGCNHLLALMIAMGPAAVQGAFSAMESQRIDSQKQISRDPRMMDRLKNTCWAWREEGPLMQKYKDLAGDRSEERD
jgi:hypothetical protein